MPSPLVNAALITGGASLLGGVLGGQSPGNGSTPFERRQFKYQKELHKNQIQWQVQDATKAGLHPLYALGNSMNFSPVSSSGEQPDTTGSALGAGISEAGRQAGNLMAQAPLVKSQVTANDAAAERDYAQAALNLSTMKRLENEANFRQDNPQNIEPDFIHTPVPKHPTRKLETGTRKGTQPFFDEYKTGRAFGFDMSVYGPRSDEPAEAFENIGGILISLPKNILHALKGAVGPYQRLAQKMWNMKYSKGSTRKQRRR